MSADVQKLAASRMLSEHELAHRPGFPSEILRQHEALLIAEMARTAHMAGRRFDGWPEFRLQQETYQWGPSGTLLLAGEVKAVKTA